MKKGASFATSFDGPHDINKSRGSNDDLGSVTVDTGLAYIGGEFIMISSDVSLDTFQIAQVTSYNKDTGEMTWTHQNASTHYSDSHPWNINLTGKPAKSSVYATTFDGPHDINESRGQSNDDLGSVTVDTGLAYIGGELIIISSDVSPESFQIAQVTSYNKDTGEMTWTHQNASTQYSDSHPWNINLSGMTGTVDTQIITDLTSEIRTIGQTVYSKVSTNSVDIAYVNNGSVYSGSGWLYNQNDITYIVTAAHVGRVRAVKGSNDSRYSASIYATVYNQTSNKHETYECQVIGADARADVMVLRPVESNSFVSLTNPGLTFGNSRQMSPGADCFIVGNPSGFDVLSISHGNIRDPRHVNQYNVETMFVSAPSLGGNSGGPIVDRSGNVIGLLTFGLTNTETMGGGCSQFMLEAIIKKILANTSQSSVGSPPWENNAEFASVSVVKPKGAFQVRSRIVTTADIMLKGTLSCKAPMLLFTEV